MLFLLHMKFTSKQTHSNHDRSIYDHRIFMDRIQASPVGFRPELDEYSIQGFLFLFFQTQTAPNLFRKKSKKLQECTVAGCC